MKDHQDETRGGIAVYSTLSKFYDKTGSKTKTKLVNLFISNEKKERPN